MTSRRISVEEAARFAGPPPSPIWYPFWYPPERTSAHLSERKRPLRSHSNAQGRNVPTPPESRPDGLLTVC